MTKNYTSINNYVSADGIRLVEGIYEKRRFYICIYGQTGAANAYDDVGEDPNDLHLMFHADYNFINSGALFGFERDSDRLILIVWFKEEKYYVHYDDYEGDTLLIKDKPEDPLFITPMKDQSYTYYGDIVLFNIGNNKSHFEIMSGGAYWMIKSCLKGEDKSAIFQFISK
ncbi:hypothetical protein DL89DRAFT_261399 [Linderina pennispora]|uniref:Uncharacterized protein n=1 Tax=Linderina pennispora TaxID=61395 RepID=A0A1Y1VVI1_9FUNG|nr:uncharacterized protein DL89DRAFT_261399 [Linderina pennispora]ORX65203.1 hypothetical protein DL89DRAFT_261399 [Linderina pennispora]